ncbi:MULTISPECIES: FGGY family carbohydrate kinase [unclassified Mycolicibacterium]|uniref:FGGY family carbohydrate kinase n=1 Tax=unclassified Mycolicibacterium TaxID=2636767 RepID=UPI0012DE5AA4|nr:MULTISPECIES: FGGY family carbohydrate kinase [unclassified Mycolicibacterium]MUL84052.1 carbohydrate kinase [Mycolicibacterium sp. CBMA 329]MUL89882.1 carbohydrate kinase [Mycolicibacterium sp. CBMA 331]MUM00059.1 carbohydrate kinase [Mycolicibacterium sp. CBMA 334]MUM28937.1 carbohydrate kinase [Mycolicibacterium sp. CBMA 295]MUM39397.1 carbohydrate kinase [Mycolicibacterium sp. CBMA 247]
MTVLAIDQGTSGTKAIVVDPEHGVVGLAEVPVHPRYLDGGGVEQDPAELLESVLGAGRAALEQAGRPVEAVSLANQGETVLAWDPETGRPLTQAIVWQDRRAEALCTDLAQHADLLAARTGLVLDPYFSAPKMAWLRRNVERGGVVTTSDTWLLHQLTGEFVTDATTASRSAAVELGAQDWSQELLALFGLDGERLPRIAANDEIIGSTSAFGSDIPVGGIVVDQQAALLAEACLEPGMAKCTFGTGAFLLSNTGTTPVRSTAGLTSSVAWRVGGVDSFCVDGQVYTAASAVKWLTSLGVISGAAEMDGIAESDNAGVLCVPALAGLAAPWWKSQATAAISGMTLSTGRGHIVLAVLQGIAAQVAELVSAIDADAPPLTRLRADGGLTQSTVLMQACADILQVPVDVYPSAHATALGAAALARLSLAPEKSVSDVVTDWTPSAGYEPRWSPTRATEFRSAWRELAETTYNQEIS